MKSWRHGFIKTQIRTAAFHSKTEATIAGTFPRKQIKQAGLCQLVDWVLPSRIHYSKGLFDFGEGAGASEFLSRIQLRLSLKRARNASEAPS